MTLFNTRIAIVSGCFLMAALAASAVFFAAEKEAADLEKTPSFQAVLRGVAPGTNVSFRVFGSRGPALSGDAISDADGQIHLPPLAYQAVAPDLVTYDLSLQKPDSNRAIDVTLAFNAKTGKAHVMSRGLPAFSEVALEMPGRIKRTKADWAGIFEDLEDSGFDTAQKNAGDAETKSFKLALFDGPIQSDIPAQSPFIIEVINADGGGGPTSAGVNQYTTFNCGSPPRSGCRSEVRSQFINNLRNNYVAALQMMATQFSAVMMDYVFIVGTFFDAKQQMETQRELQTLQAEAHKDYHPSALMCEFGSFVRTVARTEEKSRLDRAAMDSILMAEYTGTEHTATADGAGYDMEARIKQFREVYCDPADNNNGLRYMCQHDPSDGTITSGEQIGGPQRKRLNNDIDFTRTVYMPLTLDIDFTNAAKTDAEEDLLAMGRNLYWPRPLAIAHPETLINLFPGYQNARSLLAQQSVAQSSFLEITAMKAASAPGAGGQSGWNFMKSMLKDFGLTDSEIHAYLGNNPSYYAQMEVLTKKIYQNPDFYTNLYDKPANIDRISASLEAFKLMQTRDLYESSLRKEMLMSLLVERALDKHYNKIDATLESVTSKLRYQ